jgi:hypothetical protein
MKKATSSRFFSRQLSDLLLCSMLFLLASCAETKWPTWITGEPGDEVINAPRPVARPDNYKTEGWPNLADVPDMPTDLTPRSDWDDMQAEMTSEKIDALIAKGRMEATEPDFAAPTK